MGVRSIRMPDVGEGVAEAEIVEWSVKVGDLVREDQVVAAVMTDKATVEIPTPVAGTRASRSAAPSATCSPSAPSSSASTRRACRIRRCPAAPKARAQQAEPAPARVERRGPSS